jgi:hypothetical protein
MQWQAYRGVTAIGGIAASGSQWVLFHTEWLADLRRANSPAITEEEMADPVILSYVGSTRTVFGVT